MTLGRQICLSATLVVSLLGCETVERNFGPIPFPIPPLRSDPGPERSPLYVPRLSALPEPWIGSCHVVFECTLTYAEPKSVQHDTLKVRLRTTSSEYPKPNVLTVQLIRRNTNFEGNERSYADWDIDKDSLKVEYRGATISATELKDCEEKPRASSLTSAACWLFSFPLPDEYPSERITLNFAKLTVRDKVPPLETAVPNISIAFLPEPLPGRRYLLDFFTGGWPWQR